MLKAPLANTCSVYLFTFYTPYNIQAAKCIQCIEVLVQTDFAESAQSFPASHVPNDEKTPLSSQVLQPSEQWKLVGCAIPFADYAGFRQSGMNRHYCAADICATRIPCSQWWKAPLIFGLPNPLFLVVFRFCFTKMWSEFRLCLCMYMCVLFAWMRVCHMFQTDFRCLWIQ